MRALALIGLVALVGCSVDNSDTPSTIHMTTEIQSDAYGVTLHPSDNMYVEFHEISQFYQDTMACLGMTAEGPDLYFKSFKEYYNGVLGGWGFHTGGTIYINTDDPVPGAERSHETDRETLKHEFIHHILFKVTGDGHGDHGSDFFALCGPGPAVNN